MWTMGYAGPLTWEALAPVACLENDSFANPDRSYWIPGAYAPALSKKRNSFLRPLKNKGFKEERMTKVGDMPSTHPRPWNPTRASVVISGVISSDIGYCDVCVAH